MVSLLGLSLSLIGVTPGMADTTQNQPPPGTLNYVEGQVALNGEEQTPKSIGSAYLEPHQQLETGNGYAEMLLTPGIYLRLGHNSAVTMIDPGLANTQVQLTKGSAMLEVDELFRSNRVSVILGNSTTLIGKQGLYEFTVEPASVKVLDGEAALSEGGRNITIKKGREVLMAEGERPMKKKFDKEEVESSALYRWSKLRADYATEANVNEGYALMASGGWWGPGWYWNPAWWNFAFMPGWGLGWGPWGFPFFSPWAVAYAPYYGFYGYGPGFYHYPVVRAANVRAFPPLARTATPGSAGFRALPRSMAGNRMMGTLRSGYQGGGFHGGFNGGFRGGMGGFHGGPGR